MRALFFWRSTSAVDLEHLAERDGVRWAWLEVDDDVRAWRVRGRAEPVSVQPLADAPPVLNIAAPLFAFRLCSTHLRSSVFIEEGLDARQGLTAWERGDDRDAFVIVQLRDRQARR